MNSEHGKDIDLTAKFIVNNNRVKFILDTGASINTINAKYVRSSQILPTHKKLVMWNDSKLRPIGQTMLTLTNPIDNVSHNVHFIVVPDNLQCLLGLTTVERLNLISVNQENFIANVALKRDEKNSNSPDNSNKLGDLGLAKLRVDPSITPRVLPCRTIPWSREEKVKNKLMDMMSGNILKMVEEPTDWVSQMTAVEKPDGSIRICLDPIPLNQALKREHFKLPTLEDILPKLHGAKLFCKVDVKQAYLHVRLDEESSFLTTMATPLGRLRWLRLAYGLKPAGEIFQKKLLQALHGLEDICVIADDILVVGKGKTLEEARKNIEKALKALFSRCKEKNIILNEEKAELFKEELTFMGHKITKDGVKPDPIKTKAITEMPRPSDIHGVKRFCGMVQYLSKFLQNLSEDLAPIRNLTKKNVPFIWDDKCETAFSQVKQKISKAPVLSYFDNNKALTLQADSSKSGLGVAILQNGKPVEFASRSLTPAENNGAQIEKELLAVVYGLERFHEYCYGRHIVVHGDHRPIEMILKKPLSQAPRRLQSLMLRLLRYDVEYQYKPGISLLIADTLSRAYLTERGQMENVMNVSCVQVPQDKAIQDIHQATNNDKEARELYKVIQSGWPDDACKVNKIIKLFYPCRDTLSIENGLIVKGERLFIPKPLRKNTVNKLHAAHMGLDSMLRRAKDTVYWPGMKNDLAQVVDNCYACQMHKPNQPNETLIQHELPNTPWEKIGVDLCEYDNVTYLIQVCYLSYFIEVDVLNKGAGAKQVISCIKKAAARYGKPKVINSDEGPQFISKKFDLFAKTWGIEHTTSDPGHQRANGLAESAVKNVKNILKKTSPANEDQYLALLEFRNTPRQDSGLSPAQIMFGRSTPAVVPMKPKQRVDYNFEKKTKRQDQIKRYYDKTAHDLIPLRKGQKVFYQNPEKKLWLPGKIVKKLSSRSYLIEGNSGGVYKRNRVHLRPNKARPEVHSGRKNNGPKMQLKDCDDDYWSFNFNETSTHPQLDTRQTPSTHIDSSAAAGTEGNVLSTPEISNSGLGTRQRQAPVWLQDYYVNSEIDNLQIL